MNECICCSNKLIRHLESKRIFWFCPSCHQEMPNISFITQNLKVNARHKLAKFDLIR